MPRAFLLGLFALAAVVGCRSGDDRPVIPTALKQPPGSDSPAGQKGGPSKGAKTPDAAGQSSSDQ